MNPLKEYWADEIAQYEKDSRKWIDRSKKIIKLYKDERKDDNATQVRYNILWSNIQTLKPALYAKDPTPEVERRFKDKDPLGRVASDALERSLSFSIANHQFGDVMREAIMDRLLPGRGVIWCRYVPHFKDKMLIGNEEVLDEGFQVTDDAEEESQEPDEIDYEEIAYDYVYYEDFGYSKARTWEETRAVWRKAYLTRKEVKERFGDKIGNEIPLDNKAEDAPDDTPRKKATIYEIWDKETEQVIWISKNYPEPLDVRDDPLKLDCFFPCPKPMFATITNDSNIPVPDYALYQDQARDLDTLSQRISMITKAIKVAGVYDSSASGIGRLLNEGVENSLIPVDNWAMFAEKGGIQGAISMLPVAEVAQVLHTLYDIREKVKQDLYEISGMSDIIRGASDPNETATAQQIKSNYASVRLNDMQRDVQRFARDLLRIAGQIIANHFQVETIKQISAIKLLTNQEKQIIQQQQAMLQQAQQQTQQNPQIPPPQMPQIPQDQLDLMNEPSWEDVDALLKDNCARSFRIDIETDSTISQDAQMEQQQRLEFVNTIGQVLQQSAAIVQQAPPLIAPIAESIMFLVRSYKVGRPTESAFQEAIDKMVELSKQPPPPPPKEPDSQVQVEQIKQQGQQQLEQVKAQNKAQTDMANISAQAQLENLKHANKMQLEQMQMKHDAEIENLKLQHSNMLQASSEASQHHTQEQQIINENARHAATLANQAALQERQHEADALQAAAQADRPMGE
jgi:hypothetical protein